MKNKKNRPRMAGSRRAGLRGAVVSMDKKARMGKNAPCSRRIAFSVEAMPRAGARGGAAGVPRSQRGIAFSVEALLATICVQTSQCTREFAFGAGAMLGAFCGRADICRRGIAFSVEALLAALVLFVLLLFSASMSSPISKPYLGVDQVAYVAQGIADAGAWGGAWLSAGAPSADDSQARALVGMAPPSVCVRAETFNGTISESALLWAYSSCNSSEGYPMSVASRAFVLRANSSSMEFRIARVSAWPNGG